MIVFPNAKINLGLYITQKRPDGLHNLKTLLYPIPFCDILEVNKADAFQFHHTGLPIDAAPEQISCVKAYQLLKKEFDLPPVFIHLHKIIPFGAGLGGGSSDAAFTLRILNRLFKLELTTEKLCEYAALLGSDDPFFIENKAALATGRGEILTPLELNLSGYYLLLVKPPAASQTAEAFRHIKPQPADFDLKKLENFPVKNWRNILRNDFTLPIGQQVSEIEKLQKELYQSGALYAEMSGSGTACFGLFEKPPTLSSLLSKHLLWQGVL